KVNDGTVELQSATANTVASGPFGEVVIGDQTGAASSAVVKLLAADQIANFAPVTVNSDGQFNTNGFAEHVGKLLIVEGNVQTSGTGPGGALTVEVLEMQGGSINGTNRLVINGNVTATSGPGIPSSINAPLDLGG